MKIETERALRMALYMEAIPDEQFDIRLWITRLDGVDVHSGKKVKGCGTVCCFVGHLPFVFPESFRHDLHETCVVSPNGKAVETPTGARFFGLTTYQFASVIYESWYPGSPSKSVVVGRFLDLIKKVHGIEDMEEALDLMRQKMKGQKKVAIRKTPVQ